MRNAGVRVVATVEAAKGLLVLAVGAGIFSLVHRDLQATAEHIVRAFHLNPASRTPRIFLDLADQLTSSRLQLLALGATAYASLHLIQSAGLWRGKRWAEWLTVVSGGIYIPVEVYELLKNVTGLKLGLLAVNLVIVAYLARVLHRTKRAPT
jgi:uncharacterized membrane protein (DUF2068 family)